MFSSDQAIGGYSAQAGGSRASSIETGTKLYISNLDYGVSNEDVKVIFFYPTSVFSFKFLKLRFCTFSLAFFCNLLKSLFL